MTFDAFSRDRLAWFTLGIFCFLGISASASTPHTFRIDTTGWASPPETIHVAGTFNGWSLTAEPMEPATPDATSGEWVATIELEPGVHQYKFVVDGERWVRDPLYSDTELEEPDGHGANNSAILIGEDARDLPAAIDGGFVMEAIRHRPSEFKYRNVVSDDLLRLTIEIRENDADAVKVVIRCPNAPDDGLCLGCRRVPMSKKTTSLGRDTWVALIEGLSSQDEVGYGFVLMDREATHVVLQDDEGRDLAVDMTPTFVTPDWAKRVVWYQVFVERFRNGDPRNDPGDAQYETLLPWTSDWWTTHTEYGEVPGEDNFYTGHGNVWQRRYGGDIQGLQASLQYLRELGVTALYLNPIFEAESMHKYDTADFRHIDDNFGVKSDTPTNQVPSETDDPATWQWTEGDLVFLGFIEEAKRQGFRVVIDGVFNHVGRAHPYFQDVLANGKNSPYADWFEITDWGDPTNWRPMDNPWLIHGQPGGIQWDAWDQPNGYLPTFKNDPDTGLAEGPKNHIFNITRRWMDPNGDGNPADGVDGWRLDVPGDIAHPFWIEWRKFVKGINPEAYITGEIWSWAQPWLQGDQFDAVMNYQFAMPALDFFVDDEHAITPSELGERMSRVVFNYPMQVSLAQMNLYDSHDTDRLASMFINPDRAYDGQNRPQDTGPNYDPREPNDLERRRMMQAVAFKMAFLGCPMIYYGSEAGMWSPDDPSNRMPMVWPDLEPYEGEGVRFREDVFTAYRHLIAMRHTLPALQIGGFEVLITDDERGIFVFARRYGEHHAIVAINRSSETQSLNVPVGNQTVGDAADPNQTVLIEPEGPTERASLAWDQSFVPLEPDAKGFVTIRLSPFDTAVLTPVSALKMDD